MPFMTVKYKRILFTGVDLLKRRFDECLSSPGGENMFGELHEATLVCGDGNRVRSDQQVLTKGTSTEQNLVSAGQ